MFFFVFRMDRIPTALFFFSSRRRHTRCYRDWSSDVCSSDLGAASTRSSCAPSPTCARQSNGTRPSMASRARAGSSTFIASRSTSKWLSSAACHCVLSPQASPSTKKVRYLDIHEDDEFDEAQFADWVKQASQLPGERM